MMNGLVGLAALLLALVLICVTQSQQRWQTLLYSGLAGIAVVAVTLGMSLLVPGYAEAFGFFAASLGMLATAGMALNHSHRHPRKKPRLEEEPQFTDSVNCPGCGTAIPLVKVGQRIAPVHVCPNCDNSVLVYATEDDKPAS